MAGGSPKVLGVDGVPHPAAGVGLTSGGGGGGAAGAEARAAAAGARVPRGELPALSARRVESAASRARGGEAIVSNVAEVKASVERGIRLWFVPTEDAHNDIGLVGDVSRLITLEHPGDSFPDFVISAVNTSFAEMTRLARERSLFRFDPTSSQWVANPSAFNAEQADFFLRQYFELVKAILVGARGFLLETAASDLDKSLGIQYKLKTWLADALKKSRDDAAYNADVEALGRELYLSWNEAGSALAAGAQNPVELKNPGIRFSEISKLSPPQDAGAFIALGEHVLASRMVGSFIKSRGMLITFFQNVGIGQEALTIHGLFSDVGGALSSFDLAAADTDFENMLAYNAVKDELKTNPRLALAFGADALATFSRQLEVAVSPDAATPLYSLFAELWRAVEAMPSSDAVQTGVKTGLFNQILHVFDKVKAVGLEGSLSECKLLISSVLGHVADEAQHAKIFAAVRKVDVLESALSAFTDRRGIYQAVSKLKLSAVRSTIEAGDFERAFALDKGESFPGFVVSGVDVIFGEMQTLVAGAVDRIKSSLPDNWLELQEPVVAASMMDPLSVDQAYELSGKVFELQRGLLVGARRLFLGSVADHPRETCSVELAGNLGIACRLQSWFVDALKIQIGVEAYKRTMTEWGCEAYVAYQNASNDVGKAAIKARYQKMYPEIKFDYFFSLAADAPELASLFIEFGEHRCASLAIRGLLKAKETLGMFYSSNEMGVDARLFDQVLFPKINPLFPIDLATSDPRFDSDVTLIGRHIRDKAVPALSNFFQPLDSVTSDIKTAIVGALGTTFNPSAFVFPFELRSLFQGLWAEVKLLPDSKVQSDFFNRIIALSEVMRKKEGAFEAQFVSQARDLLLLMLNNAQSVRQVSRVIGLFDDYSSALLPRMLAGVRDAAEYLLIEKAFADYRPDSYRHFVSAPRSHTSVCAAADARIVETKSQKPEIFKRDGVGNSQLDSRLLDFGLGVGVLPDFIAETVKSRFDELEDLLRARGITLNALAAPTLSEDVINLISAKILELEKELYMQSRAFLLQPAAPNRFGVQLELQSWFTDHLKKRRAPDQYRADMVRLGQALYRSYHGDGNEAQKTKLRLQYPDLKFEVSAPKPTEDEYFILGEHKFASQILYSLTASRQTVASVCEHCRVDLLAYVCSEAYAGNLGKALSFFDAASSDVHFFDSFDRLTEVMRPLASDSGVSSVESSRSEFFDDVRTRFGHAAGARLSIESRSKLDSLALMVRAFWNETKAFVDPSVRANIVAQLAKLSTFLNPKMSYFSSLKFSEACKDLLIFMLQNAADNPEQSSRIFDAFVQAFKDKTSFVYEHMSKPEMRGVCKEILDYVSSSQYTGVPATTRRGIYIWGDARPWGKVLQEFKKVYDELLVVDVAGIDVGVALGGGTAGVLLGAPAASGLAEVGVSESKNDGVVAIAGGGAAAGTGVLASGDVAAVAPAEGSAVAAAVPKVTSPAISVNLNASLSDEAIKMKLSGFAFDSKDYPMATFARDVNGGQYRIAGRDIAELYQERYGIRPGDPGDDFGTRFPELIRHHLKLGLEVPVYSSTPQGLLGCIMDPAGIFGQSFLPTDAHPVEGPLMGANFYGVRQEVRANFISVGGTYQVEVVAKLQGLEAPPQGASGERAILPLDATVKYRAYAGVDGVYKIIPDSVVVSGPDAVVVQEALLQTQLSDEVQRKLLLRCFLPGFTASTAAELQSYFTGRIANAKTVKDVQALLDLFLTQSTIKGSLIQRLLGDNTKVYSVIVQGCVDRASSLVSTTKTVAGGKARYGVKKTGVATASSDADREIFAQIKSRATSSPSRARGRKQDSEMVGLRRWVSAVKRFIKVAYGSVLDRPAQNVGLWFDGCFRCFGGVRRAPPVGFRPNNVHVPDGSPSSPPPIAAGTATAVAPAALSGDKAVIGVPGVEPKASTAPAGHDL